MLFFFPHGVLDEILNLIESVSEGFPSYFCNILMFCELENAVYISLRERIRSPKEVAPLRILNSLLKEFAL